MILCSSGGSHEEFRCEFAGNEGWNADLPVVRISEPVCLRGLDQNYGVEAGWEDGSPPDCPGQSTKMKTDQFRIVWWELRAAEAAVAKTLQV